MVFAISIRPIALRMRIGKTHVSKKLRIGELCVGIDAANSTPAVFSRSVSVSSGQMPVL